MSRTSRQHRAAAPRPARPGGAGRSRSRSATSACASSGGRLHRSAPAVQPGAPARAARSQTSPSTGLTTTPATALAADLGRRCDGVRREPVEVVDGAVDGVDDPGTPLVPARRGAFLAEDAVVGPGGLIRSTSSCSAGWSISVTMSVGSLGVVARQARVHRQRQGARTTGEVDREARAGGRGQGQPWRQSRRPEGRRGARAARTLERDSVSTPPTERPTVDLRFNEPDEEFRAEFSAWLAENLPTEWRQPSFWRPRATPASRCGGGGRRTRPTPGSRGSSGEGVRRPRRTPSRRRLRRAMGGRTP